ncbi:claudin-17 isoform X2 [Mesocricetus auratus]|uniref:Claudin-17 isoform X2 n=1 Tax=Mesocricetus auratus TaxID=10036 RepID=A0ABM2XUV7_MESAU|nr:claudin-17 isoform X2 [Mesocricetus auratus]
MAFYPLQIAGLVLGFFGLVGTIGTTLLPQWRVSAFIGSNIIIFERIWEGLWMNCIQQARVTLQLSWTANIIIRDFYDPNVHMGQKRELGGALFLGWATVAVLFIGGGLLCGYCCCNRKKQWHRYPVPAHRVPQKDNQRKGAVPSNTSTSYV